jgi:hypothetical protein
MRIFYLLFFLSLKSLSAHIDINFSSELYTTKSNHEHIIIIISEHIKSLTGSLKNNKIALFNIKPIINNISYKITPEDSIYKISYSYYDQAVTTTKNSALSSLSILAYNALSHEENKLALLLEHCTEPFSASEHNLWYFFDPALYACKKLYEQEPQLFRHVILNITPINNNYIYYTPIWPHKISIYIIQSADLCAHSPRDRFGLEYRRMLHILSSYKFSNIEIKTFFAYEGDNDEQKSLFCNNIKDAFKNGDVIVYNGHSFMGHAAINYDNFKSDDFKKSYQLFFINSCNSYGYFSAGFLEKKNNNLDIIANAFPSSIEKSGDVVARFVYSIAHNFNFYNLLLYIGEAQEGLDPVRILVGNSVLSH